MRFGKKTIVALALCIGVFFMAVGYSILMSELKINGTANITSTWDVRITGISGSLSGDAYNIEAPSYTTSTAKFNVSLVNPGDYASYTITIKNQGTLTAILNKLDITSSGTDAIVYSVKGLKEGDTIAAGATKTLVIKVDYNSSTIADPEQRIKKVKVGLDWMQYTNQTITAGTYTINYNANGGSGSMSSTTCTINSDCSLKSNSFTKSGYSFIGWATSPTGAPVYGGYSVVNSLVSSGKSVTLYAIWVKQNTYAYTGNYQTYTVPEDGYYLLEVWGAEGGYRSDSTKSGKGGYSKGTVFLQKGTVLYIYVGGSGKTHNGYNGGGISGCTAANGCDATIYGGGGTDIRIGSHSLYARVIVAGGGGSVGGSAKPAAAGGGTTGGSITTSGSTGGFFGQGCSQSTACGMGGTQTAGGAGTTTAGYTGTAGTFGQGGMGYTYKGTSGTAGYGGGGGGGWYGGSGSVPDSSGDDDRGGGGGSGYVLTSSSSKPTGYLLGSAYYMKEASTKSGTESIPSTSGSSTTTGRSGDGYARITRTKL